MGAGAVLVLLACIWGWRGTQAGALPGAAGLLGPLASGAIGLVFLAGGAVRLRRARGEAVPDVATAATTAADTPAVTEASAGAAAARAREQIEREVAARALDERSRLLSAVAQDLRQPLYAMSLTTRSLQRPWALRNPGPLIAQLRSALESADALLDAVDTLALLETGTLRPRRTVFSVQTLLERIDLQHGPQARARGLRWTVTPSLEQVNTDALLLERMLDHLVANAVRSTEGGGVLVSCRRRGACLLLQVWDTGPGFDDAALAAAPTELRLRGAVRAEPDHGAGLGLPVLQRAAQLLGIGLSVRSRVGHGTCVSLRVPVGQAQAEALSPA